MITLREFKSRRTIGVLTQSLAELTFTQLFEQWTDGVAKMTMAEDAAYRNEARIYRDMVGLFRANEIMDQIRGEYE